MEQNFGVNRNLRRLFSKSGRDCTWPSLLRYRRTFSGNSLRVTEEIKAIKAEWMAQWMPKLTSDETPLSPYRVLWDLMHTVDRANTVITHDAGGPRDQLSPFWETVAPLTYIGWGKSTQLGYGLGLAMGAKLARPERLCINVIGDAAIGMTGMDFETAARERIPILTVLLNNFSMAIELPIMKVATEKYGSTNISGIYTELARARRCSWSSSPLRRWNIHSIVCDEQLVLSCVNQR